MRDSWNTKNEVLNDPLNGPLRRDITHSSGDRVSAFYSKVNAQKSLCSDVKHSIAPLHLNSWPDELII